MNEVDKEKIIEENFKLYRLEEDNYVFLHPEIYNWFEQNEIKKDISFLRKNTKGGNKALDIGCGMGNITLKLLEQGFNVTALDISTIMIKRIKDTISKDMVDKLKIVESEIDTFLLNTVEQYDLVTMSSVLHHLPDYINVIQKIIKKITAGGFLYIVHDPLKDVLIKKDPLPRKLLWQIDYLLFLIKNKGKNMVVKGVDWRLSDYHLYKGLDHEKVRTILSETGFKVYFKKYSSVMRLGISNWIDTKLLKTESQFKILAEKIK